MKPNGTESETGRDECTCGHIRLLHAAPGGTCLEWRCDCRAFELLPDVPPAEAPAPVHAWIAEANPEALTADGFDAAIIGVAERCGQPTLVVYDARRCIEILGARHGMSPEEADEFFRFNTLGAWVGPQTPLFLWRRPA